MTSSVRFTNLIDHRGGPMDGTERYRVHGHLINAAVAGELMERCRGLLLRWDCIEKAKIVQEYMRGGLVVMGSCFVASCDGLSEYGHEFNPPLELHAWWQARWDSRARIDIGLPGLITTGLQTSDEVGPFLVDREPMILAGIAPAWAQYLAREALD
jgi:hypothetical protein